MIKLIPQKAENADLTKLRFPAIASPKIDGVRGLFITSQFTGRSLKPFKNRNITDIYSNPLLRGFDGELCYGDIKNPEGALCRNTTGLVNSLSYNTNGDIPHLHIFDYVTPETYMLPYKTRIAFAKARLEQLNSEHPNYFTFLHIVPDMIPVNSLEEVESLNNYYLEQGYEGTVLRYENSPHKNGRSTVNEGAYMRIKEFQTAEGKVIGFTEAQENLNPKIINELGQSARSTHKSGKVGKGMIGSLLLLLDNGEEIQVGPGKLSHTEREVYFENPSYILDKYVTYRFMSYGSFNKPRFAMFENFRAEEDMS